MLKYLSSLLDAYLGNSVQSIIFRGMILCFVVWLIVTLASFYVLTELLL